MGRAFSLEEEPAETDVRKTPVCARISLLGASSFWQECPFFQSLQSFSECRSQYPKFGLHQINPARVHPKMDLSPFASGHSRRAYFAEVSEICWFLPHYSSCGYAVHTCNHLCANRTTTSFLLIP